MLLNTGEFREKECRDGPNAHTVKSYDILKIKKHLDGVLVQYHKVIVTVEECFAFCLCEDVQWHL
jgi:hypothetical protein